MNNIFKNNLFPFHTTKEDIDFLFEMVRKSPYVAANSDYSGKAERTEMRFTAQDDEVNAYAQSLTPDIHQITMLGGLCNALKLVAVGLAYFNQNPDKKAAAGRFALTFRWIGNEIMDAGGLCTLELVRKGMKELCYETDGMIAVDAKSYAAGSMLSVIGHELGHICLSHTLQGSRSEAVSRNDERQADLFGCNVSVTTPFASHIVLSNLFAEVLIAWLMGNDMIATTHPHSRERVHNAINAHDVILNSMGINHETINWFLPPEDSQEDPPEDSPEDSPEDPQEEPVVEIEE